ncbi:MAG: HNH endonuclease [Candidatus Methylumidiphilus sp.]
MITNGIRISWEYSDEYIEIDLDNLENVQAITNTIEWWGSCQQWVKYYTESEINRYRDGSIEIIVAYKQQNNQHLVPEEIHFGHTTVRLSPGQSAGKVAFVWDVGEENRGTATWERVDIPLVAERQRETVSRIQRKQAIFRSALIAVDECCVLTGEQTVAALEAAHIIPAKDGGAEVIENGILLRADLHKLFDAGLFSINSKGEVSIKSDVSESYSDTLSGKKIPEKTLHRIRNALNIEIQRKCLTKRA